jgi:hypothetical protein
MIHGQLAEEWVERRLHRLLGLRLLGVSGGFGIAASTTLRGPNRPVGACLWGLQMIRAARRPSGQNRSYRRVVQ